MGRGIIQVESCRASARRRSPLPRGQRLQAVRGLGVGLKTGHGPLPPGGHGGGFECVGGGGGEDEGEECICASA